MAGTTRTLQQSGSCRNGKLERDSDRVQGLLEVDVFKLVGKKRGATHV